MDTQLIDSRPRFELSGRRVAECGVTAQPIVEHLDVLEDVLCCLFVRTVPAMINALALQCAEAALDTGVVPTVTGAAHAGATDQP